MTGSTLINHRGGRDVTLDELTTINAPPPTATWFPVPHVEVFRAARQTLMAAGYAIGRQRFSVSHEGHRFFGALDLESRILDDVSLAVGIRNSTDKSFPIGFCCGQRVFVCDNLAFTSEIVVAKKHTRFGQERYQEGIACAVHQLAQYQQAQADWIGGLQARRLSREEADSLILRSYEEDLIGARALPQVLKEWRQPQFDEFRETNAWSLWNAFTTVLGRTKQARPADAALTTIKLQRLFTPEVIDGEVVQAGETQFTAV
ncbi:MAG: DUF932 domain-containing protein [Planctomycetes bacterium]|nr:DUF932 domain-containing protein [Planctomycetota bacterium]